MSTKKYVNIASTSKATAARDLQQLRELGAFVVSGEGPSTRYHLNIDEGANETGLEKLVRKAEAGRFRDPKM